MELIMVMISFAYVLKINQSHQGISNMTWTASWINNIIDTGQKSEVGELKWKESATEL